MEEFSPQRPPPIEVCHAEVESSDLFVLLLAHRYGARPPGEQRSYTELEYEWATARAGVPLLVFVVDPAHPWPPPDIDQGADASALSRFVARVKQHHVVREFADVATFREDLLLALGPRETAASERRNTRVPPALPAPPAFHAVPPYVGSAPFTGRAADFAWLDEWGRATDPLMVVEAIGGAGKSALTWQWSDLRAPDVIGGLAGRIWWSFYDGSASMARFLQEVLGYVSTRSRDEIGNLEPSELTAQVFSALRTRPYLLVLDGFERLLGAYHRFDPTKLRDEEVAPGKRTLIEPLGEYVVRELTAVAPSKVLISTRLMPDALEGRFGPRVPGVRHMRLPGLTESDTITLLGRLGVRGTEPMMARFFRRLDNHPLLIGIVAGLVRDYRPDPGGFDRWLADPTAGGMLTLPELDMTQRRNHILAAALNGLPPGSQRVLTWISVFSGAINWNTLEAINPFRPPPPVPVEPDLSSLGPRPVHPNPFDYRYPYPLDEQAPFQPIAQSDDQPHSSNNAEYAEYEASSRAWQEAAERLRGEAERATRDQLAAWSPSESVVRAQAQLDAALNDLEDRGLLWWDRASNTYDLHPIVRAYTFDQTQDKDRIQANEAIRDYFEALPPEDPDRATCVEDLRQTITIFQAMVGAELLDEASSLWASMLEEALLVELGAYSTVVELLAPLSLSGSTRVRGDLTIAYMDLGQYDEAIEQEKRLLATALETEDLEETQVSLTRLSAAFGDSLVEIGYSRCLQLRRELSSAAGESDPGLTLANARQAIRLGDVTSALTLLDEAERLGAPQNNPWYDGDIHLWRLYLALVADRTLTEAQLTDAEPYMHNSQHRRGLLLLRRQLLYRQGRFEEALAVAHEQERLARNAGEETVPAAIALLLAKLGRQDEATAALNESLGRLHRLHPAVRPHYHLARTLRELGQNAAAAQHAHEFYRQAWADGPPNCHHWDLKDAHELLTQLGLPAPNLPTIKPATIRIPMEDEIRAFIAELKRKL
jgi:hypothetical protein